MSSDVAPDRQAPASPPAAPSGRDRRQRHSGRAGHQPRGGPPWRDGRWQPTGGRRLRHGSIIFALLVGAVQIVGVCVTARHQPGATHLDALGYGLIAVSALALPFRLRWRVPALVVTLAATLAYVLLGYPYGPFLAVLISIFGAIRTGHRIAAWISLGVAYALLLATGRVFPTIAGYTLRQGSWVMAVQLAVWLVLAVVIAEVIRVRTAHFGEIRRSMAEQARAHAEQERRQATEERLRIAQELHDVLGHHLSLINVQAGVGLHLMADDPDQARVALEAIKQASTEALGEVRAVLAALRPKDEKAPRAPMPSLANLSALVDPASAAILGERRALPPEVDRAAYRIVQESLTNVRRHAGTAATAMVTITYGPDRLSVRVADDGYGAPSLPETHASEGTGIAGMRTRAEALGGTLEAGPGAGGGFVVSASLPIPPVPSNRSNRSNGSCGSYGSDRSDSSNPEET